MSVVAVCVTKGLVSMNKTESSVDRQNAQHVQCQQSLPAKALAPPEAATHAEEANTAALRRLTTVVARLDADVLKV